MENILKVKNLIIFEIVYILYLKFFIDTFKIPEIAWYLCDIINVLVLMVSFTKISKVFTGIKANYLILFLILFLVMTLLGHFINEGSITLYIWGLRNLGRMFVFLINCILNFDKEDIMKIFRILYLSFILNFIFSLYQFFVLGIRGDYLGGIFGTTGASNSFSLNLLVIISALAFIMYLDKRISLFKLITCILISMFLATFAELKAYYVMIVVLAILTLILQKRINFRTGSIIFCVGIGICLASSILAVVFPDSIEIFTLEGMQDYLTDRNGIGYSSTDDLSRTGAVSKIHELFFEGDFVKELFGFGLGNCEASNISIFNSSFYDRYEYLHYRWFFHAMTYIELGMLGIVWFLALAIWIICYARKQMRKSNRIEKNIICLSIMIILYSIIIAWYNSSLRIESGYLLYFVFAVPFVFSKKDKDNVNLEDKDIFRICKIRTRKEEKYENMYSINAENK